MSDRDAFIAAIIEKPDDDAVRLVFADWLEERGDSDRAESIRVLCEIKKDVEFACRSWGDGPEWKMFGGPLWAYGNEDLLLLVKSALPHHLGVCATVRRGFIEEIRCSWEDCAVHMDFIRRRQPIRKVVLTECPEIEPISMSRLTEKGKVRIAGQAIEVDNNWTEPQMLSARWPGIIFELPCHKGHATEEDIHRQLETHGVLENDPYYHEVAEIGDPTEPPRD